MPDTTDPARFFTPLEALRGIAALGVVVFHADWTNPVTQSRFVQNCPLMVDFFFVLSGFVICHSYGERLTSWVDVRRFLWLRLGRLYPLHLTFLLIFAALVWGRFLSNTSLGFLAGTYAFATTHALALVSNALLAQSMGFLHSLSFNYPSWSISTEFYTYVLFAAACVLLGRGGRLICASVAIVAGSVALLAYLGFGNLVDATYSWGFIRCTTGFFLGVLVWGLYSGSTRDSTRRSLSQRAWVVVLPLALVATGLFLAIADTKGRASYLFPLLSGLIILAVVRSPVTAIHRTLASVPLRWLGKRSYSVYMTHALVQRTISQVLDLHVHRPKVSFAGAQVFVLSKPTGSALLVAYVALVLVLSQITFALIEEPCRLWSREMGSRI